MRKITKSDEGAVVWAKPNSSCPVQKRKILRVWEDADSYEFKYDRSEYLGKKDFEFMVDNQGFSPGTYRDTTSDWQIAETISRYDQPLDFWREIKIGAIRMVHLIMERLEFNLKN